MKLIMGRRLNKLRNRLREERDAIAALRQNNITLRQLPYILREWRVWLQIFRNLKELEGSWSDALRINMKIMRGRPRKSVKSN